MFLIIPTAVDYRAQRYPVVTFTIMGLNVAVYLISLIYFFTTEGRDPLITHLGLIPAEKVWFTWITSFFVHAGFFHILGNMIYLFLFGSCVEDLMGRLWYTVFYIGCGLLANVTQVLLTTNAGADIPIVGASGAISACIGAFLVALPKTKINFRWLLWIWIRLFNGEFWLAAWIVICFWFAMDFGSLLLGLRFGDGRGGGVAVGAHVGGTLAGALIMWLVRKKLPALQDDYEGDASSPVPAGGADVATIYISTDGNQVGPYSPSAVREMVLAGTVPLESYYWRHGMADWRPVGEL